MSSIYTGILPLQPEPIDYLDAELLDARGRVKLLQADAWKAIPRNHLLLWCHRRARYGIPTLELIAWLKAQIADRSAIEIGAGMGDLGHHLHIRMSDSFNQQKEDVADYYEALGIPTTTPPADVERADAIAAVRSSKAKVVVGSWITQKWKPGDSHGNIYGVDEERLLRRGVDYILIGNERVHGDKRIMRHPHETHALPFLVSRAIAPEFDRVWIWRAR